jgi:hypothetical protein
MRLSKIAILAVKGTDTEFRGRMAEKCNVSINTINRWIRENDDNLTKADPLQMIREETGLSDQEILEEEVKEGTAAEQR